MKGTPFVLLCLEGAVLSFNVSATAALIPTISSVFRVSSSYAGAISWVYMVSYGLAALLYGPLARRYPARKIELICFLIFCLGNLLAAAAPDIRMLLAARLIMGLFGASVIPLVLILVASNTENNSRGRLVGIFFSVTFLASLAGLVLSGYVNWRLIYLIPGIFGLLVWIHMYMYLRIKSPAGKFSVNYLAAFSDGRVLNIYLYIFAISLFYHGIQQWFSVFFCSKLGFSQLKASMFITLASLSGIFGEAIGGFLSDSLGRIKTLGMGLILMAIAAGLLMTRFTDPLLAVILIVWGLGWTINHAGLSTLLTDMPSEFLNESASLNSAVRFISGGLGTILGGLLMRQSLMLYLGFFTAGLAAMIIFTMKLKQPQEKGV